MRRFLSYIATALAVASVLTDSVAAASIPRAEGEKRYIVLLNDQANHQAHMSWLDGERATMAKAKSGSSMKVTNDYDGLNGYTVDLSPDALAELSKSPDVLTVVEDKRNTGDLTQRDAPWGISRVSRRARLPVGSNANQINYVFNRKSSGAGVDVYVLDTGVNIDHVDFQGRARWGATFGPYGNADGHGHGTHVAGTIAGKRYGVAKAASIIAVKVLGDDNSGWNSDLIAALDWCTKRIQATGRPSVLNISIGSDKDTALNIAVNRVVIAGAHVVVSAGNDNKDAKHQSPASAVNPITVGATNINDQRWVWSTTSGSNYGKAIDIFAPGEDITSTWIGSTTATNRLTGTSMAAPHVSGLIAYLLAVEGRRTPGNMRTRLKQLAPDGVLTNIPSDTINELIWNGGAGF